MDGSGRRVRSGDTWAAARQAYLHGASAGEVCVLFELGLSALRARARRDGWRRIDQPDPDPDLEEDIDGELDEQYVDYEVMAERTGRLASRALHLDDAPAAERWLRLHLRLLPLAERQHQRGVDWQAEDEAQDAWAAAGAASESARATTAPEPADVHSVHLVHPKSECTSDTTPDPAAPRVLNRADRRRRERLAAYQAKIGGRATPADGP